jgi:hypothetical protein
VTCYKILTKSYDNCLKNWGFPRSIHTRNQIHTGIWFYCQWPMGHEVFQGNFANVSIFVLSLKTICRQVKLRTKSWRTWGWTCVWWCTNWCPTIWRIFRSLFWNGRRIIFLTKSFSCRHFAHVALGKCQCTELTRCVVTSEAHRLHQANRLRLVVKTGSQNFKNKSRNLYLYFVNKNCHSMIPISDSCAIFKISNDVVVGAFDIQVFIPRSFVFIFQLF